MSRHGWGGCAEAAEGTAGRGALIRPTYFNVLHCVAQRTQAKPSQFKPFQAKATTRKDTCSNHAPSAAGGGRRAGERAGEIMHGIFFSAAAANSV